MSNLFVPFSRLGAENTDIEGSGLGLVVSRKLVEAMGGAIQVESVHGQGSIFSVVLPTVEAADLAENMEKKDIARPFSDSGRGRRQTVLYIEDNSSNRRLVQRVLEPRSDIRLILAAKGETGLMMMEEHLPSVVLLDLQLPDISGEEVLARLRGNPKTEKTQVIVLSADATPATIDRLREAGANDYLTKPFDVAKLVKMIDVALVNCDSAK